jgi:CYTH domain-containing protein
MASGTTVTRTWVVTLTDGRFAIDWGDELFQEIHSGEFLGLMEAQISHPITNEELEWLRRIGRVVEYDSRKVVFFNLPERPQKTIE